VPVLGIETSSGRISYVEQGRGPVALFVHGALLNSHLWRHQLEELADVRRSIALDLAHGDTEIAPDQAAGALAITTTTAGVSWLLSALLPSRKMIDTRVPVSSEDSQPPSLHL